jgi:hypothetical protein
MKKKVIKKNTPEVCCTHISNNKDCFGATYFLGFIGSAIYFVSTSTGFWNGVLGVLKSLVWPAFLIYELFKFLGA